MYRSIKNKIWMQKTEQTLDIVVCPKKAEEKRGDGQKPKGGSACTYNIVETRIILNRQEEPMEQQEGKHKRRVRYAGTHPRTYKEKYKEHDPEKYADTVAKVIS